MKNTITFAFIAFILVQVTFNQAANCPDGQWAAGDAKCAACDHIFTTCTSGSAGKLVTRIVGYGDLSGTTTPYCSSPLSYNKNTNNCEIYCKQGCSQCMIDYDFCTDCQGGYTWNNDFTCIPATIGLEAASLALLAIGLVFSVIGCCTVIKAKKN